jgi:FkbM family methyltransferase
MVEFSHDLIGVTDTRVGKMFYPRNDLYIGRSLELYGEYARLEYEIFKLMVHDGDTVIDAGANIGVHTVLFSKLAGASGRVIAFEPQRALFQILNANLMMNGGVNTETWQVCLGQQPGHLLFPQTPLDVPETNFGGIHAASNSGARVAVERRTIDQFPFERCDFIKIDVEGAEREVVAGAAATISAFRPSLCIEADNLTNPGLVRDWFDPLLAQGYSMALMRPLLYVPANWKNNPTNVFGRTININVLCFPSQPPAWVAEPGYRLLPLADFDAYLAAVRDNVRAPALDPAAEI